MSGKALAAGIAANPHDQEPVASAIPLTYGRSPSRHGSGEPCYVLPYSVMRAPVLEGGRWYCFEMMAKMNRADRKDGEVQLWVDGQLVTEMTGLVLRNATHAAIQWDHWLLGPRYGDSKEYGQGPPRELKSWIDGIVVATSRIGPAGHTVP